MAIFDRMAAARYASQYATTYNDNFPAFSYIGGDCTNFVSQAMLAGGWPMLPGAISGDPLAWWARPSPGSSTNLGTYNLKWSHTRTWTSAGEFYNHLEYSKRCELCTRDDLDYGDIVQMRTVGEDNPHHTMIVTAKTCGFDGTELHVSYHSYNKLNVLLASLEEDQKFSNDLFIFWKVKSSIPDIRPRPYWPSRVPGI
jgi:Putative amidase domain